MMGCEPTSSPPPLIGLIGALYFRFYNTIATSTLALMRRSTYRPQGSTSTEEGALAGCPSTSIYYTIQHPSTSSSSSSSVDWSSPVQVVFNSRKRMPPVFINRSTPKEECSGSGAPGRPSPTMRSRRQHQCQPQPTITRRTPPRRAPIGGGRLQRSVLPTTLLPLLLIISTVWAHNSEGRCFSFTPGKTIEGSDYRRDYGVTRKDCAETCKIDGCCMAYEWRREAGMCTLKSRSLNGSVTQAADPYVHFGLCLDAGDVDRDRFWDHELVGPSAGSVARVHRDECRDLCSALPAEAALRAKRRALEMVGSSRPRRSTSPPPSPSHSSPRPAVYSWKIEDPEDVDGTLGNCECITALHGIKLSFGSFAGFLL